MFTRHPAGHGHEHEPLTGAIASMPPPACVEPWELAGSPGPTAPDHEKVPDRLLEYKLDRRFTQMPSKMLDKIPKKMPNRVFYVKDMRENALPSQISEKHVS